MLNDPVEKQKQEILFSFHLKYGTKRVNKQLSDFRKMAIAPEKLETLIKDAFPDAEIQLDDMLGDQDHYGLTITSSAFDELNRVQCHQKIYAALGEIMGGELHALSIRAKAKSESKKDL